MRLRIDQDSNLNYCVFQIIIILSLDGITLHICVVLNTDIL